MFKIKNIKKSKLAAVAIGTAVKVLTAVVCGAVVLTGTYGVVKHTVLPTSTAKTKSMFAYEGGADTGGGSGGSAGDNPVYETEIKRLSGEAVPEGATYKLKNGTVVTTFPETPTTGDTYTEGDYEYRYGYSLYNYGDGATVWDSWSGQNGWGVKAKDNSKASYGALVDEIAGKKITAISQKAHSVRGGMNGIFCLFFLAKKLDAFLNKNIIDIWINTEELKQPYR